MKNVTICKLLIILLVPVILLSCPSNKVQELTKENSELRAKNEALEKEITELRTQTEELKAKFGELKSREDDQTKRAAREAVRALQKLDARFSAGISPVEFPSALGETIFEVNEFLESPEAGKMPQVTEAIKKTLFHYVVIGQLMDSYMTQVVKTSLRETLESAYPEVSKIYRNRYDYSQMKDIAVKFVVPEASKELERAKSLLPQ